MVGRTKDIYPAGNSKVLLSSSHGIGTPAVSPMAGQDARPGQPEKGIAQLRRRAV